MPVLKTSDNFLHPKGYTDIDIVAYLLNLLCDGQNS